MKQLVLTALVAVLGLILMVACEATAGPTFTPGPTLRPTAAPKPTVTPIGQAILWCQDCADIGMEINLWNAPQRSQVVGSLPHGTRVTVLEKATCEGRTLLKVRGDAQMGWVTAEFLKR
jgi:hypothetical protein